MRLDSFNIASPQHPLAPRAEPRPPRPQDPVPAAQINLPAQQRSDHVSDAPVVASGKSSDDQPPEGGNAAPREDAPRNTDGKRGRVLDLVA